MAAIAESVAETPILDSAVRPKGKRKNLVNIVFGILLGIPFGIALIVASSRARAARNPAADYLILIYILAFVLAIVLHELGHLLAGWTVGFHFSSITVGPFSARLEYGRLRIQVRRTLPAGGYAGMHVDRIRRLRRRLLIFTFAGPLANLVSAALTAALASSLSAQPGWLSTFCEIFWMISVILGLSNLLPIRLGVLYPDGARIRMLLSSRDKSRRWMSLTAIGAQSQAGVRAKQWRRTWLEAAGKIHDGTVDDFAGNWIAYFAANDRKDAPVAAAHLERCLALSNLLGPSLQDFVALEAAVFTAWFRQNAATAQRWFDQVKHFKSLPQLMQIRAEIALRCARRQFEPALARLQDALAFVEKLPNTPIKARLRDGLIEWRDEICEREQDQKFPAIATW